jgi:hypothetical protein
MDRRLREIVAALERHPDPDRARELARLASRARGDVLGELERAVEGNSLPELLEQVWRAADRVQRLPSLSSEAFMSSPPACLPQVQMVQRLEVRQRRTRKVVVQYAFYQDRWRRNTWWGSGWRIRPENAYRTVELLEFLDAIRGSEVRGEGWSRRDDRLCRELYEDEASRSNYGGYYDNNHPWDEYLGRRSRAPMRGGVGAGAFEAVLVVELPKKLNAPMFRDLTRKERARLSLWSQELI